jgi:hypothetical protein
MAMNPRINELPSGSNGVQNPVDERTKRSVITSALCSCESRKELSFALASVSPILIAPLVDSQTGELVRSIHRLAKEPS